jgi:hypothetical protein
MDLNNANIINTDIAKINHVCIVEGGGNKIGLAHITW